MELWLYKEGVHEQVGTLESFSYVRIIRKYDDWGTIELQASIGEQSSLLRPGTLIQPAGSTNAYILDTIRISDSEDGEIIEASGLDAAVLLNRRCLYESRVYSGTIGSVASQLCAAAVSGSGRGFSGFAIDFDKSLGAVITYESEPARLGDAVLNACRADSIGLRSEFDPVTRALTVRLYQGADHSIDQPSPVVFDMAYENINGMSYSDSTYNMANVVYVIGEAPPKASPDAPDNPRTVRMVQKGTPTEYGRYETLVYSRKSRAVKEGNDTRTLSEAEYLSVLDGEGLEHLEKTVRMESFDGELVEESGPARIGADYDIGDIVTARNEEWQVESAVRIREIEETYEDGLCSRYIVLGDPLPTIMDKITRG